MRPPSVEYALRSLQALQKALEEAHVSIDEELLTIVNELVADRARKAKIFGSLEQRPGEVRYCYKTFVMEKGGGVSSTSISTSTSSTLSSPTSASVTGGVAAVTSSAAKNLDAWANAGVTVKVNQSIGNVGLSVWPGRFVYPFRIPS